MVTFSYQNPAEALFQGAGRIALYNNLFVNTEGVGRAINIMPHEGRRPETVDIFHNTVVASDLGIGIWDTRPEDRQWVAANAVFARRPIHGGMRAWNITGKLADAEKYLNAPLARIGVLDLYPRSGRLEVADIPIGALIEYEDADKDFNGWARWAGFVGAYTGSGENPGWQLGIARWPSPGGRPSPRPDSAR
ncbi:hypothetical protein [Nitrococcus mobilis]|nr:hypothetical protein [Nitrococcus mobilis]